MNSFYLIGFAQSLFFILLILTKKNKVISDYLLSFFVFLLGSQLLFVYGAFNEILYDYPILITADIFYWVLLGPVLVIYTKLIISGKNSLSNKYYYLLIPALLMIAGFAEYIFDDPKKFFSPDEEFSWFQTICVYIWYYNTPIFFLLNLWILKSHSARYKKYFSYSKNVDLKWLYFLSAGFAIFLIFMLLNSFLQRTFDFNFPSSFSYTWFVMVLYIFGIGFYGYRQKGVFSSFEEEEIPEFQIAAESFKSYQKSGLIESEANKIIENLEKLMTEDRLFLNSEIDLSYLAEIMETSTHKLSQVMNEKLGRNFFDFINGYRIKETELRLTDSRFENLTILAIAFECGFNSKSAFYNMFKKTYRMTPSEYRKKHRQHEIITNS